MDEVTIVVTRERAVLVIRTCRRMARYLSGSAEAAELGAIAELIEKAIEKRSGDE